MIWIILTLHEDYESGTGIFNQIKQNLFTNNETQKIQEIQPVGPVDTSITMQSSTMLTTEKQQSSGIL